MEIVLPHSEEHEESLIVALLTQHDSAGPIFDIVSPNNFFSTRLQTIAGKIHSLFLNGEPHDVATTVLALKEDDQLEKAGGAAYIKGLTLSCPVPASNEYYASKVSRLARDRRFVTVGNKIMQQALNPGAGTEDINEFAHRVLSAATHNHNSPQSSCRQFQLRLIDSMEITTPTYIVDSILEVDTLFSIFGAPESCKSLLATALLSCVGTGTPFHGLEVKQGPVIYIAGEGQSGIRRRFGAWSIVNHVPLEGAPIYVSTTPIGLCNDGSIDFVLRVISEVADTAGPPVLIIIDTLARNFGLGDENSTSDMTRAIAAADRIRESYHSAVGLIHHSGVIDKNRGRGNSALRGAIDSEYRMEKDGFGIIRFEATKMKDAGYPDPMAFRLSVVELGIQDEDGNEVSSVVLRQVDNETSEAPSPNAGLGKNQSLGLHLLSRLYQAHRGNVEDSGRDPESARVLLDDWSSACKSAGMNRQSFYKVKKSMIEKGVIQVDGPYVLPSPLSPSPFVSPL